MRTENKFRIQNSKLKEQIQETEKYKVQTHGRASLLQQINTSTIITSTIHNNHVRKTF